DVERRRDRSQIRVEIAVVGVAGVDEELLVVEIVDISRGAKDRVERARLLAVRRTKPLVESVGIQGLGDGGEEVQSAEHRGVDLQVFIRAGVLIQSAEIGL